MFLFPSEYTLYSSLYSDFLFSCIRFESIKKKKPCKDFIEDIAAYVSSNIKLGTHLVPMLLYGDDPMTKFDRLFKPTPFTTNELKDENKKFEYREEYKVYSEGKTSPKAKEFYLQSFGDNVVLLCRPLLRVLMITLRNLLSMTQNGCGISLM